ncbi:MAG: hypothetical protein IPL61_29555 [Myxococcales bacterium]|nr:hypothetical protein [Myxococcales bacterium]
MQLRALALALIAATACGGGHAPRAVSNESADPAAAAEPEAVLAALADAIAQDDGAALAALVDPDHGLTLWYTPGAGHAVFETITAGDVVAPSRRVHPGLDDTPEAWSQYAWSAVRASVTAGLAKLDRDPLDPRAAIYGDCGDMDQPVRAYLIHDQDDRSLFAGDLSGDGEVDEAAISTDLAVFNNWGFTAYLRQHAGRWYLRHLVVQDVCSA